MDQLFTAQFWHDQWAVVMSAPWVIIPLLVLAAYIGWRFRKTVDDGEIRGYRAQKDAAEGRLELAHDQNARVVAQVEELTATVAEQNAVIAALKSSFSNARAQLDDLMRGRVEQLAQTNTAVTRMITNLSTSTADLGTTLTITGPRGQVVVPQHSTILKSE
jgi:hypothetical protein